MDLPAQAKQQGEHYGLCEGDHDLLTPGLVPFKGNGHQFTDGPHALLSTPRISGVTGIDGFSYR